mmetsp:Transcript_12080/g.36839  ORF Transcript_12080/g.36839 Transcript_12080/m.36839 type:complete len:333 (-) Transcript_12080:611-1609(-)
MSLFYNFRRLLRRTRDGNGPGLLTAIGSVFVGSRLAHRAVILQISMYLSAMLGLYGLPIPSGGSDAIASILHGLQTGLSSTLLIATISSTFAPDRDIPLLGPLNSILRPHKLSISVYYEVLVMALGPLVAVLEGPLVVHQVFMLTRWMEAKMRTDSRQNDAKWQTAILAASAAAYATFSFGLYNVGSEVPKGVVYCFVTVAVIFTVLAYINPDGNIADAALTLGYCGCIIHIGFLEVQFAEGRFKYATDRHVAAVHIAYLASSALFVIYTLNQTRNLLPSAVRNVLICIGITFRFIVITGVDMQAYSVRLWRGAQLGLTSLYFVWYMLFGDE